MKVFKSLYKKIWFQIKIWKLASLTVSSKIMKKNKAPTTTFQIHNSNNILKFVKVEQQLLQISLTLYTWE